MGPRVLVWLAIGCGFGALAGCGDGGVSAGGGPGPAAAGSGGQTAPAGTGGAVGTGGVAGSGGSTGSGGAGAPEAGAGTDAGQPAPPDGGAADLRGGTGGSIAVGGTDGGASGVGPYACTLILGIQTTSEWFGDFEKLVDGGRWEIKYQDSAHIEKWADPANAVWSLPVTSPCTSNAMAPDRVLFMGVNYDFVTVEQFLPRYIAVLNNVKAKYPTVERMDVMTYTRGPGNKECIGASRSGDSYIKQGQDDAIAMFAAMYPDFVFPAPKWEVSSCADFTLCPHLTGGANQTLARTIAAYFGGH